MQKRQNAPKTRYIHASFIFFIFGRNFLGALILLHERDSVTRCLLLIFCLKLLLAPNEQAKTVSLTFLFIRRYLPAHSEICDMLSYKRVFWRRNCRTRRPPLINTLKIWKNYSVLNLVLHRLIESNMLNFKRQNSSIPIYYIRLFLLQ